MKQLFIGLVYWDGSDPGFYVDFSRRSMPLCEAFFRDTGLLTGQTHRGDQYTLTVTLNEEGRFLFDSVNVKWTTPVGCVQSDYVPHAVRTLAATFLFLPVTMRELRLSPVRFDLELTRKEDA